MKLINQNQVEFFQGSVAYDAGKVFFFESRVFRGIFSDRYAQMYNQFLKEKWIDEIFEAGLVHTVVSDDIKLEGALITLEHKKIPFMTHPAERTPYSFWLSAKTLVRVNLLLSQHGYVLIDAHPWNVMLEKGNPKFIDFTSVYRSNRISRDWFEEFKKYFCIPIWLSSNQWHEFSREYRREHLNGFGLKLFETRFLHKIFSFLMGFGRVIGDPVNFLRQLDKWLDEHRPKKNLSADWPEYPQYEIAQNPLDSVLPKEKFILEVLRAEKPVTVLDCAANKGHYSEIAALLGASVASFNYEEQCVDECLLLAQKKNLDITPVVMDFKLPTPPHSIGLLYGSAYKRFKSEIVIALGLVHHLCIFQRLPVHIFCKICMKYATKGILFEYVDPTDSQVKSWGKQIPDNYSIEGFNSYFNTKFSKSKISKIINDNGSKRVIVYYFS